MFCHVWTGKTFYTASIFIKCILLPPVHTTSYCMDLFEVYTNSNPNIFKENNRKANIPVSFIVMLLCHIHFIICRRQNWQLEMASFVFHVFCIIQIALQNFHILPA